LSIWYLYVLECEGGKLYAGIATDVERRFASHAAGKGAAFTRMNRPIRILGATVYADQSAATRAEVSLKKMPRASKLHWVSENAWRGCPERSNAETRREP
jgi:putative endonuclease